MGRFERVGVCGSVRFLGWMRGMAGVGAPMAATGARSSATSSASLSSSSLVRSEMCDMLADLADEEDEVSFEVFLE